MLNLDENFDDNLSVAVRKIMLSYDEFLERGSGWILDKVKRLELKVASYVPLSGSSFLHLPQRLENTKSILNIVNEDNKCYRWCILAALHPQKENASRVAKYLPYEHELNCSTLSFPIALDKIPKFETLNEISVNVFGYTREDLLEDHVQYCSDFGPQKIKMPDVKNKWLTFDNFKFQLMIPYVIYADFECVLPKVSDGLNNPEASSTNIISKHVPCGYSYLIVGPNGRSIQSPKIYRGENAVSNFLESLLAEAEIISKTLRKVEKIDMSKEQEQEFQNAVNCHICGKVLGTDRVRDHDHLQKTNNYRGAAHSACNLNYKLSWKIPVIFHNLRCYDSHLIVQELGKLKGKRINCIANNMEKYISFSIGQLQFLDSLQFLPTSLQKLVENLSPQKFVIIREHFKNDEIPLLFRKGVYPYEYPYEKEFIHMNIWIALKSLMKLIYPLEKPLSQISPKKSYPRLITSMFR
ncbi:hypothetical protein X975_08032, partial [Stegodyphus mimosarum]